MENGTRPAWASQGCDSSGEKTEVVNLGLGWGSEAGQLSGITCSLSHSLRTTGHNQHLLGARYGPGPTPGIRER